MAKREDTSIRESLTRLLPPVKIRRLAVEAGALKRRRKVDIACFVYSLVLGFAVGSERSIAGLRRTFERATGESLAPSAFYDRFTEPLVLLLERLVAEALSRLAAKTRQMRGLLARFEEVLACDSTLLRLHDALEDLYPSIWPNRMKASAKLSVVMNIAGRGAKSILISPGSTHDLGTMRCGPWLRGRLLIFDLGYFRSELFREIGLCGGTYLSRQARAVEIPVVHPFVSGASWKDPLFVPDLWDRAVSRASRRPVIRERGAFARERRTIAASVVPNAREETLEDRERRMLTTLADPLRTLGRALRARPALVNSDRSPANRDRRTFAQERRTLARERRTLLRAVI